jgi:hypothetical protein
MNGKLMCGVIISLLILLIAGCSAPTCYPPNKILGNKCCLDEDSSGVCDYEEPKKAVQKEEPAEEEELEAAPEEPEPQIQRIVTAAPAEEEEPAEPRPEYGKMPIGPGEPKKYLTIDEMSTFKISRDKAYMDYMVFTVRNIGETNLNPVVELLVEGARVEEYTARVKKEYFLPVLKPGEKNVVFQSLGIKLGDINKTKQITMTIHERYTAPRQDIETLKKQFDPADYFVDDEIHTYGLPETE